jgi:hypothetical protein
MDQLIIQEPLAGVLKNLNARTPLIGVNGEPLGEYLPLTESSQHRIRREAIEGIRKLSEQNQLDGLSIREMIVEGRR